MSTGRKQQQSNCGEVAFVVTSGQAAGQTVIKVITRCLWGHQREKVTLTIGNGDHGLQEKGATLSTDVAGVLTSPEGLETSSRC